MRKAIVLLTVILLLLSACSGSALDDADPEMKENETASNQPMISRDDTDDAISQISYRGVTMLSLFGVSAEEVIDALGAPGYRDDVNIEYQDLTISFYNGRVGGMGGLADAFTINGQSMCMRKDEIIQIFGKPASESELPYGSALEYRTSDCELTIYMGDDIAEDINFYFPLEPIGDVSSTDDDYSNDDGNYGNYVSLDYSLCGRWRSYDGGMLEFDDSGLITSCDFKCWSMIGEKPDRVYWEASNGRVTCSAYIDKDFTYKVYTQSRETDLLSISFSDGRRSEYNRKAGTVGDGIVGTWGYSPQTVQFNADGTGLLNDRYPFTWYEYTTDNGENAVSRSLLDSTYFDYSITGNTLTVFLSDGSRVYTKVGD